MVREVSPKGHKLGQTNFGVGVYCECGWRSMTHFGKGARQQALIEWRSHQAKCTTEAEIAQRGEG